MSIFLETNHLFLRDPRGGVENVEAMRNSGFGAIFCNVGDHDPEDWDLVRERARFAGVVCGPWLRTANPANQHEFDPNRLHFLIETAASWKWAPFIVNSEKELDGSGDDLTSFIAEEVGDSEAAISVEAWPYESVEWGPLCRYPILPQIFPAESDAAKDAPGCIAQWRKRGAKCVVPTFGAYSGMTPDLYDLALPYGVYTADDMASDYHAWIPTGHTDPCKEVDDDMEPIGDQHGITAFIDWLQAQPGMPARKPNYDPAKPGTWPWPERLERTLNLLREDYDSRAGA